jgi:hypothetical protein
MTKLMRTTPKISQNVLTRTTWVLMMHSSLSFTSKRLVRCTRRGLRSVCYKASGLLWWTVLTTLSIWFITEEKCGTRRFTIPTSLSSTLLWRNQICTTTLMMTLRSSLERLSTDLLLIQCCLTTHLKDLEWVHQVDCRATGTLTRATNLSRIEDFPTSGKTTLENSQR